MSHRSFTIVFFALISAIVLLITAKRLDQVTWDTGSFNAAHFRQYATGVAADPDTSSTVNITATTPTDLELPILQPTEAAQDQTPPSIVTPSPAPVPTQTRDPICDGFPDTSNILLVMKTGATESYDRVPVQIMTTLKCLDDFLLFSDLEQYIGGYHVRDSLETVLEEAKKDNDDFNLYRMQQECAIDQKNCIKNLEGADSAGWNLDKYKNIHMAEKTYRLRPNYDWYVFIDADTYVSWPNVAYALNKLDPSKERYLGVVTLIGSKTFGHGGSGYVVSQAAMKEFAGKNPGIANKYDVQIKDNCCGDFMFALALHDTIGINVEGFWPISNGEKPFTAPFGPNHWCHPVGMLHHMNSEEISSFWEYERKRYQTKQTPLLFKDVYQEFVEPKLQRSREDWDNHADDWFYIDFEDPHHEWEEWRVGRSVTEDEKTETERKAHLNWQNCQAACEEHKDCFQFKWTDDCCSMHRSIRLGRPTKKGKDEKKRIMSGWNLGLIDKWNREYGDCKDRVDWPGLVHSAIEEESMTEEQRQEREREREKQREKQKEKLREKQKKEKEEKEKEEKEKEEKEKGEKEKKEKEEKEKEKEKGEDNKETDDGKKSIENGQDKDDLKDSDQDGTSKQT